MQNPAARSDGRVSARYLVPLYRLEVDYAVRHGRRWSALEHLILWSCREPASADDLALRSGMPVRLVSECLVNLLRAGWIELRASPSLTAFAATEAGSTAAGRMLPDRMMETQPKSAQIYMERLSGEFFGHKELSVVRRNTPGFRPDEVLPANLFNAAPFGPELVDRLPLGDDDTFERLREQPRLMPGDLYAAVEVGPTGIEGLPPRTTAAVGLAIAEAVRAAQAQIAPGRGMPPRDALLGRPIWERGQQASIAFGTDTLVVGGTEHLRAAEDAIRGARRIVVIHSTFVGRNIWNLMPALLEAAAIGVQIHLHWGKSDDPEGVEDNPSEAGARLARTEIPQPHRSNVHLGASTSGSHAKVILADTGENGGYCALVGSCNWLDSPYESVEASVRLTEPGAIAHVAGRLAALLAPVLGHDLAVSRLMDVHGDCAARPRSVSSAHSAMLVVDDDHYAAVRDAMRETAGGGTVLLGSHKFGRAGGTTVIDPMLAAARQGARVKLFYTRVLPGLGHVAVDEVRAALASEDGELRRAGRPMHAKFIAWRDRLLITSFNFLSGSVNGRHRSGAEIGVLLTGAGIVEKFEARLAELGVLSEYQEAGGHAERRPRRRRRRRRAE